MSEVPKKGCLLLTGLLIVLLLLVTVLLMDGLKAPKTDDDDDIDEDVDVEEEEGAMKSFIALSATTSTFCNTLSIPMHSKQMNTIKA